MFKQSTIQLAFIALTPIGVMAQDVRPPATVAMDMDAAAIEPHAETQLQIKQAVEAFDNIGKDYAGAANALRSLATLRNAALKNREELLHQLAHFAASGNEVSLGAARGLLQWLEIPENAIVNAFAAYLGTGDRMLHEFVEDKLESIDGVYSQDPLQLLEPVNYKFYKEYISRQINTIEPLPKAFVQFIYRRSPNRALLAVLDGHRWPDADEQPIMWAEHVISDAIWRKRNGFPERFEEVKPQAVAELEKLSQHDAWWVRLYVAEIVQLHPEIAADGLVERLRQDKHELVREALDPKPANRQ